MLYTAKGFFRDSLVCWFVLLGFLCVWKFHKILGMILFKKKKRMKSNHFVIFVEQGTDHFISLCRSSRCIVLRRYNNIQKGTLFFFKKIIFSSDVVLFKLTSVNIDKILCHMLKTSIASTQYCCFSSPA